MLDTIKIFTNEFMLMNNNKFRHQTTSDFATGEFIGEKVYCNLPHFNIDIKKTELPKRTQTLFIQTSLPKLIYRTSLYEIKEQDTDKAIKAIEQQLKVSGVQISNNNLGDFGLSRIDYCRNIQVENNIIDYLLYFNKFHYSKRIKTELKNETVTYRNKSQQLTFYNKIKEIQDTEKDKDIIKLVQDLQQNILRIESRIIGSRTIRQELKSKDVKLCNIFSMDTAKNKLLKDINCLVQASQEQTELVFEKNTELMNLFKSIQQRNVFNSFIATKGAEQFLYEFNFDYDKIFLFLSEHFKRSQSFNIIRQLKTYQRLIESKEQKDLLKEIRSKIAA